MEWRRYGNACRPDPAHISDPGRSAALADVGTSAVERPSRRCSAAWVRVPCCDSEPGRRRTGWRGVGVRPATLNADGRDDRSRPSRVLRPRFVPPLDP
jgi:hypothetical protein